MTETGRADLPPHSVETEENLLGALMMNPEALPAVLAEDVRAEDFFIVRHGWIYDAMLTLHTQNWPIDNRTLATTLAARSDPTGTHANLLEAIGGEAYLHYLPNNVPTALNARFYAMVIQRAAVKRQLLGVAGELSMLAYSEDKALDVIIPESEALLASVVARWQPPGTGATKAGETLMDMWAGEFLGPKIPTGLPGLDARIHGGWRGGRLHIIAGRPGMGKTLELLFSARFVAKVLKKTALVCTYEMTKQECINRMICMETGLDYDTVADEMDKPAAEKSDEAIKAAVAEIYDWPLYFVEDPANTPQAVRRAVQEVKADVVFIDRIGLMSCGISRYDRSDTRERYNYISRALKQLTNATKIPIIIAAQLNRECEKRPDKRPMQMDLKESGNLEQDADIIIMLYRHVVYYQVGAGFMEFIVVKSRNARPGRLYMTVDLEAFTIADALSHEIKMYKQEIE